MTSEHEMSSLESRIVGACHSSFNFHSQLRVKGLVAVTADDCATTFVDIDKTISHDDHGKLEVGPRNALQQWKKSQNEQVSWQNQRLQQQQPRMRGEVKSVRASAQSPSQRFRMQQMPNRGRMLAPPIQSPRMSNVRMLQPCVPQSVVRLKKIPSHLAASQSIAMEALSAAKSFPTKERHAMAGHNEGEAKGATRNCFLPSDAESEDNGNEMNNSAHPLGVAQLYNKTPLPSAANRNKRKTGNQEDDQLVSSGSGDANSKEAWKKIPKLPKQGMKVHSEEVEGQEEEEEMKEVEDNKSCKPQTLKKISKVPHGQKTKTAVHTVEHPEEDEDKKEETEEEDKKGRPTRAKAINKITAPIQTTTQDVEDLADEFLTSKAAPRKRPKKVEQLDEAKMPRLEKVVDGESFWNTFVSKGTGKKKAVGKQAKS